jgi:hypothetical protein
MLVANKRCISTTTPSRFDREKSLNSSPGSYQAIGRQRDKKLYSKSQRVSAMNQRPGLVRHLSGFSVSRRANNAATAHKPFSH